MTTWRTDVSASPRRGAFAKPHMPDRFARERSYDVKHICLRIRVDEKKKSIRGTAAITLSPINDGFASFRLDAAELSIRKVRLVRAPRLRAEKVLRFSTFDNRLEIELHRQYQGGDDLEVAVDYEASPRKGLYFIAPDREHPDKPIEIWSQGQDEDSRYWFPCYDFPNDKATSEVIVTVNRRFFALSNGELLRVRENKRRGLKTYHWKEEHPHAVYLTSLVIGEYVEFTDEWDGIPITYYVHPADKADAMRSFAGTPDMMRFFSKITGYRYPYEKYAQICVTDFTFGGMENISATTLSSLTLHDRRAHQDVPSERLVAHELAHQWWGNLLTCKDWSHGWLNEGFATYFDALYTEHSKGRDEFHWQLLMDREVYFEEDETDYRRSLVERKYTDPLDLFDRHLYEKGGQVLHMLRFELGEELFWKAIGHYCRKFAFESVETSDFKIAIEEATGKSMDLFFEQWVLRPGYPEFETEWSWEKGLLRFRVKQVQDRGDGTPLFRLPAELEVTVSGGAEVHLIRIEEADQSFFVACRRRPVMVRLDPEGWLLKKLRPVKSREEWLLQLEKSGNALGKIEATEALASYGGDREVLRALDRAMRPREFWAVRGRAARALGRIGTGAALEVLLRRGKDESSRVRRSVARALERFGRNAAAGGALTAYLRGDSSYYVRAEAARSLGKSGAPKAFDVLVRALRQKSHKDIVAATALRGLVDLDPKRAHAHVRRLCAPGRPRFVRDAALRGLGTIGRSSLVPEPEIRRILLEALRDDHHYVRLAALSALGELRDRTVLAEIGRIAEGDLQAPLRKAAREAAERIRNGSGGDGTLKGIRGEVDSLRDEIRRLRDQVAELEAHANGRRPGRRR